MFKRDIYMLSVALQRVCQGGKMAFYLAENANADGNVYLTSIYRLC